jgi:phosphotransferase system IIA component
MIISLIGGETTKLQQVTDKRFRTQMHQQMI